MFFLNKEECQHCKVVMAYFIKPGDGVPLSNISGPKHRPALLSECSLNLISQNNRNISCIHLKGGSAPGHRYNNLSSLSPKKKSVIPSILLLLMLLSSTSTGKDWRKYMLEKHWQFN
jgi:hypothetical protein